jgi:hypothetical protein
MSTSEVLTIGSTIKHRGEYNDSTTYYANNQVTMYDCIFQAIANNFKGMPPAKIDSNGEIALANTTVWKCILNNISLYNAALSTHNLDSRVTTLESAVDSVKTATDEANTKATNAESDAASALSLAQNAIGTISIEELDTLTDVSLYEGGNVVWKVVSGTEQLLVGHMELFTDDSKHVFTQVLTSHYKIDEDGAFSEHQDNHLYTYYRSYNNNSSYAGWDRGTWSDWAYHTAPLNDEGKIDKTYIPDDVGRQQILSFRGIVNSVMVQTTSITNPSYIVYDTIAKQFYAAVVGSGISLSGNNVTYYNNWPTRANYQDTETDIPYANTLYIDTKGNAVYAWSGTDMMLLSGTKTVYCTQNEYDAMAEAGTLDADTEYNVMED